MKTSSKILTLTAAVLVILLIASHYFIFSPSGNVLKIPIHGEITLFNKCNPTESACFEVVSEDVLAKLDEAKNDKNIKAVMLDIISEGGEVAAADEIYQKIKSINKPVIAYIRGGAFSSSYHIASAADQIFATKNSRIGVIGVTMSYIDYSEKYKMEGLTFNEINTGKYKEAGSPDRPLSKNEKAWLQKIANDGFDLVLSDIALGRKMSVKELKPLADGRDWLAGESKKLKLIDQVGYEDDVIKYLEELIKVPVRISE